MKMRKPTAVLGALAAGVLLTAGSCGGGTPPCQTLKPPTAAEVQATVEGAEVERELTGEWSDAECVVVVTGDKKGVWEDQTDDEA